MQKIYALPSDGSETFGALADFWMLADIVYNFLAGRHSGNSVWQLYTHRKNGFCLCAPDDRYIGQGLEGLVRWGAVCEN